MGIARPVIPRRGEKEFEPAPGSGLQEYSLARSREAMVNALRGVRGMSRHGTSSDVSLFSLFSFLGPFFLVNQSLMVYGALASLARGCSRLAAYILIRWAILCDVRYPTSRLKSPASFPFLNYYRKRPCISSNGAP
jgi:hypothetical protein